MSKPVDLIVANVLHEAAARRERLPDFALKLIEARRRERDEALARDILVNLADQGSPATVVALLAAAAGLASLDEVGRRYDAVCEQRRTEAAKAAPARAQSAAPSAASGNADGEPAPDARLAGYVVPFPGKG
jgi:hypothetical protein